MVLKNHLGNADAGEAAAQLAGLPAEAATAVGEADTQLTGQVDSLTKQRVLSPNRQHLLLITVFFSSSSFADPDHSSKQKQVTKN